MSTTDPHGVLARHAGPGQPIEIVCWGGAGVRSVQTVSDRWALQLAADLVAMVLSNAQEKARHQVLDREIRSEGPG